jgi:hypothetical protein
VECTSTTCPGYTARAAVANSSSGWTATTSSYAGVASVLVNAAQVPATPWTVGANAWAAGCSYGPCCFGIYTGSSLAASDLIMWGQLSGGAFTGTTGACTTCVAASTGTQVSFPIGTYSGGTCTAGICLTEQ